MKKDLASIRSVAEAMNRTNSEWVAHMRTTLSSLLTGNQEQVQVALDASRSESASVKSQSALGGAALAVSSSSSPSVTHQQQQQQQQRRPNQQRQTHVPSSRDELESPPLEGFHAPAAAATGPNAAAVGAVRSISIVSEHAAVHLGNHNATAGDRSEASGSGVVNSALLSTCVAAAPAPPSDVLYRAYALPTLATSRPQTRDKQTEAAGRASGLATLDEHLRKLLAASGAATSSSENITSSDLIVVKSSAVPMAAGRGSRAISRGGRQGQPRGPPSRQAGGRCTSPRGIGTAGNAAHNGREVLQLAPLVMRAESPPHATPSHSWALPTASIISTAIHLSAGGVTSGFSSPQDRSLSRSKSPGRFQYVSPCGGATLIPTAMPISTPRPPAPECRNEGNMSPILPGGPSPPTGPRMSGPGPRQHVMERGGMQGSIAGVSIALASGAAADGLGNRGSICFGPVRFGEVLGSGIQRSGPRRTAKNLIDGRTSRAPPAGALLHLASDEEAGPLNLISELR